MLPEPIAVTVKVTAVLEKLGIPYFIDGSLASTIYGLVRTTQDSDIVAELQPEHIELFAWVQGSLTFPSIFQLVVAMNPCLCSFCLWKIGIN